MQSLTEIVDQIKSAVKVAEGTPQNPEKKLRELVSPIWQMFLKEKRVGLNLQIREELTLANGKADTVFNRLILEYKKPYAIKPDNNKNRQLIAQVQGYILDFAKKERFSKERLLGVAFDGDHFLFMKYVGRWIVDDPLPVTEPSLEIFLKNLEKLTSKAALIPENLIRDFAVGRESRNKVAVDCIKAFYQELNQHGKQGDTKEHVFFDQWKVQFSEVHGSLEQKKIDKETLFTSYGFSKNEQKDFNVLAFFFALDSYYALLMKLLSYQVVGYYTLSKLTGLPLHDWETLASEDLKKKCNELEEGGIFRSIGIRNFLEGDLFSWYIEAWNEPIYRAIQQIIKYLNDYDPETMEIAPDETRDILKKLYQYLVPKQIRHDLGEYYTPDWLAERCLNQLNYNGNPALRILDPACGSGTFLILAIKRAKEYGAKKGVDESETLKRILYNIQGFDLNPLAVISARTNYLMAIADLLRFKKGEITIPIYLCDSINPPQARIVGAKTLFPQKLPYEVKTTVGNFYFPHSIISKRRIQQLANLIEDSIKATQSNEDFLKKVEKELQLTSEEVKDSELHLIETYDKLLELERKGINGVWARIIKNAFAPMFVGDFDLIVGNPPWVTWGSLPKEYRVSTENIWSRYDLFEHKGLDARLGKSGDDISVLMTYVSVDRYLKQDGKLCFVITQSLFQSVGGGQGFRRFALGSKGIPFNVIQVDDLVELQPFDSATNRTAVFVCQKGDETKYPVEYHLWRKKEKGSIAIDLTWKEVQEKTSVKYLRAQSVDGSRQGPWLVARPKTFTAIKKVLGGAQYRARMGAHTGGGNGIYWVNIKGEAEDGNCLLIENNAEIGKIKYPPIEAPVEKEFLYPLLRGREAQKWRYTTSLHIILPQNMKSGNKAYSEDLLLQDYPHTFSYFEKFKKELLSRAHYKKHFEAQNAPFYSIYNVGTYTFSKYKMVWKYISQWLDCCVIEKYVDPQLGEKVIIPDTKLVMISFDNRDEPHYVCSLLNSSISKFIVKAYVVETQLAPHILKNIAIPQYDSSKLVHKELSRLSQSCHEKVTKSIDVTDLEGQIDELAAELWGLSKEELKDIKDSLEELK
jgi:SAM-dependent methyltransferase